MHFSNRLVALAGTILLASKAAQAKYQLDTTYDTTNFFDQFDFFTQPDPTKGFVEYVDGQTANKEGLAGYSKGGIYMGVDYKTVNPANGRKSVRVTSKKAFTRGLFIADILHMPGSICGSWPAYWMFGPNWPGSGEIDIIEGVNAQTKNAVTLHTSPGCTVSNTGTMSTTKFASANCGAAGDSAGCGQQTADNQNYGDGFNTIGGGVYALQWTSEQISVWFFPRSKIPQDINSQNPTPQNWGQPVARFVGGDSCSIDKNFANHNIVFDITFCGTWAGNANVWGSDKECSALAPTCQQYVSNNPQAFADAHWVIKSINVYNESPDGGSPSQSAPLPSASKVLTLVPDATAKPQTTFPPPLGTTLTVQPTQAVRQKGDGQVWNGQPQQKQPQQSQPQQKQQQQKQSLDSSNTAPKNPWNGQPWNGQSWNARRRLNAILASIYGS